MESLAISLQTKVADNLNYEIISQIWCPQKADQVKRRVNDSYAGKLTMKSNSIENTPTKVKIKEQVKNKIEKVNTHSILQ